MGEKSVLLLVILFIHAKISLAGCSTNDGTAKLNQDAAQYIFQKIYDDLTVAVSNMDFVSSSHKYVNSLRRPLRGEDINLDINTEITANPIQNLMFDIFAATGKDKSIYMCYHDKHFLSYRTVPEKVFSIYDNTSAQTVSYSFNLDNGQANTNDEVLTRKDYDCTGRPWYIQGSASDNCPSDENKKLDCRMTWTDPYIDYQVNQLVISANMGVPMYSGPATLPEIAGGFLEGGRAVDDSLLGVIASDYFLDDVDKILAHAMNKVSSESSDVAYLMTSDLVLLAVSDGSINTECVTSSCSEQNIILATDSPSQRIKTSARYLRDNNIMSDNTLLMTHLDTQFVRGSLLIDCLDCLYSLLSLLPIFMSSDENYLTSLPPFSPFPSLPPFGPFFKFRG